jgi:hypothetical protein
MNKPGGATVSAALIVLICFFLPWVQVSCGASKDTATGIDLARDGDRALWLIPFLMLVIIVLGIVRAFRSARIVFGLTSLLGGLASLYLMNHQRLKFEDTGGLISARMTGWFWLGLGSSIGIVVFAIVGNLRIPRNRSD